MQLICSAKAGILACPNLCAFPTLGSVSGLLQGLDVGAYSSGYCVGFAPTSLFIPKTGIDFGLDTLTLQI